MSWKKEIKKDERFDDFTFNMANMAQNMFVAEKNSLIGDSKMFVERLTDFKEKLEEAKENTRLDRFVGDDLPFRQIDNLMSHMDKLIQRMEKELRL